MKKAKRSEANIGERKLPPPTYLREVVIRYKKKRVKNGSPVGQLAANPQQVVALFADLQNETKEKFLIISQSKGVIKAKGSHLDI